MLNFWRNVSSVFTGTVVAQLIPILGSLLLTRIFSPEAFGEFSVWLSAVVFFAVVITLRFEAALAIVEDGLKRKQAVFFSAIVSLVIVLGLLVILLVADSMKWLSEEYFFSELYFFLLVVPGALALAYNQIWQSWAAAEGFYSRLTIMRITQAVTLTFLQIIIGMKYPSALSLAIGFTVASCVSFFIAKAIMPKVFKKHFFKVSCFGDFLKRYKKFPLYALPADSINTAAAQLPVIIVAYRFGADTAGFLALTMRVLGAPIGLVGKATLDVFKRYAVQEFLQVGNCRRLYINTLLGLSLASLVLIIGTFLFGELIFKAAFGKEWVLSGVMAVWLLPMFAMRFVASPLSYIVYIVEKQHIDLFWQIALFLVVVLSLSIFDSYKDTLVFYSVSYALMYFLYIWMSYCFSKG